MSCTALGHVLEYLLFEFVAGGLEGQGQLLVVDFLQNGLNALVVDEQDVLEDEHQAADLFDEVGVLGFEAFHDSLFSGSVGKVEDFGDGVDAAGFFERLADDVGEAVFEAAFDFLDDLRIGLLHIGDAFDDFDLLLAGEADENLAGFLGGEMGEDQRDRLRVFILDEGQQVFAFSFLEKRKRGGLHLLGDLLDDAIGVGGAEGFADQGLGVVEAAFAEIGIGQGEVVKFAEDLLSGFDGDFADAGDFAADFFHGLGWKALEDFRRLLLAEREKQDRGFPHAAEFCHSVFRTAILRAVSFELAVQPAFDEIGSRIRIGLDHLLNLINHALGLDGVFIHFQAVEGGVVLGGIPTTASLPLRV